MPLICNFFAGPGAGKSTSAALLFANLKMRGVKCELVTEFAKDLTWEKRHLTLENQLYILAKQHKRMWVVAKNGVDVIITDSPLLIGTYYSTTFDKGDFVERLKALTLHLHHEHPSLNFLIQRTKPYQQYGRSQNEDQAKVVDSGIRSLLEKESIPFIEVETAENGLEKMLGAISREMGRDLLSETSKL